MEGIVTEGSGDFECYKSHFGVPCKAKDIGLATYLECLEENPRDCKFSVKVSASFSQIYLCQSPRRVFIAKTFKK